MAVVSRQLTIITKENLDAILEQLKQDILKGVKYYPTQVTIQATASLINCDLDLVEWRSPEEKERAVKIQKRIVQERIDRGVLK